MSRVLDSFRSYHKTSSFLHPDTGTNSVTLCSTLSRRRRVRSKPLFFSFQLEPRVSPTVSGPCKFRLGVLGSPHFLTTTPLPNGFNELYS